MNDRFLDVLPYWLRTTFQVMGSLLGIWFVGIPIIAFYSAIFLAVLFVVTLPVWVAWYWFFTQVVSG